MQVLKRLTLIAMTALLAGNAQCQGFYAGLSRTTPGEMYMDFATAKHVENYNSPLAIKLYGGLDLTEHYSVEAGYGFFGTWKVADPAPGSRNEVRTSSKLIYLSGKAAMPLGDSFSLFGKLGVAANRFSTNGGENRAASSDSWVRPMLGFGADYKLSRRVSAALEFDYYGANGKYTQQKLELGLKYAF
jgi:OOP family OmpA-OmpF porin